MTQQEIVYRGTTYEVRPSGDGADGAYDIWNHVMEIPVGTHCRGLSRTEAIRRAAERDADNDRLTDAAFRHGWHAGDDIGD